MYKLQSYFCTPKIEGNDVTIDFKLKEMSDAWGGLVYAVPEDFDQYRFLEMDMSSNGIKYVRIEVQSQDEDLGMTMKKLLHVGPDKKHYSVDLRDVIPKYQRGKITELKIIVDSMYIRKNVFDHTSEASLELSDIVLKTKKGEGQ